MGRVAKVAIAIVVAIVVLLVVNTLIVDGQTREAELTRPGSGRILALPGGDLQVVDSGDPASPDIRSPGAPIVYLHCYGCSSSWVEPMAGQLVMDRTRKGEDISLNQLAATFHRVISIDLLGHGGSAKPKSGYSIEDQSALVAAALDRLGVQGAVLVGHDLGGAVAVSVAERASELVDRVVLIDAATDSGYGELSLLPGPSSTPVLGEAIWRLRPDSLIESGYGDMFASGYEGSGELVVDSNRAMTYSSFTTIPDELDSFTDAVTLDQRISTAAVPLMVIFGEDDRIYDAGTAAAAYSDVPGAELETIPGAGHSPMIEKPAATAELIAAFAAEAPRVPPPVDPDKPPARGGGDDPDGRPPAGSNKQRRQ